MSKDNSEKKKSKKNNGSFVGPMTDTIIENIISELKKKKNRDKIIKNVIDPLLKDINERFYPHMLTGIIVMITIVILLIVILIMITIGNKETPKIKSVS